jgi:hypothetical protein
MIFLLSSHKQVVFVLVMCGGWWPRANLKVTREIHPPYINETSLEKEMEGRGGRRRQKNDPLPTYIVSAIDQPPFSSFIGPRLVVA